MKKMGCIVGCLVLLLGAMAFGVTAAEKSVIGFIPMTLTNEYFITMVNAAQAEAARHGVELLVRAGSAHDSVAEQMQIIEEMIARQVDAICIVPSSSEGVLETVALAVQARIPVINIDTKFEPDVIRAVGLESIPFIGTNNYDGAKMGGDYALTKLNISGKDAVILTGMQGHKNAVDRRNGFYEAVSEQAAIVAEDTANWDVEQGYSVFLEILQNHPDISVVFASNDNMGLGALRVLQEFGKEDVIVIGYDGIGAALEAIEEGIMKATIAQFPAEMGIQGVQAALKLINGKEIPEITYTKTKVIDASNVAEFKAYLAQFK